MDVDVMKCMLVKDSEISYSNQSDGSCVTTSPDDINDLMYHLGISGASEEYFYLICLNTASRVVGVHEISHGTLDSAMIHPREVFKRALLNNAYGVILVHNHPSGNPTPSEPDIETTHRLVEAGKLLGVPVVDHVIVTPMTDFYSFNEMGELE